MKLILYIDTSQTDTARVAIDHNGKRYEEVSISRVQKSQMVLPLIEKLLHVHNLHASDITEIRVKEGPGSFTGIRVGLTVANMLAALLGVSINGTHTPASPSYLTSIFSDI